jgi:phospholipid/cholesterol/gamma-HCH transport system substrate-binding protein
MGKQRTIEIAVGAFMAAGIVALFFLSMKVSNLNIAATGSGYALNASFQNIGSLKVRAPVTMAGVRIGRVSGIRFDQDTFEAVVELQIEAPYNRIPSDTFASVLTAGLLGEQYVGLDPGGSDSVLKEGDAIVHTQSALVLEQIVGQFLFSKAGEGNFEK